MRRSHLERKTFPSRLSPRTDGTSALAEEEELSVPLSSDDTVSSSKQDTQTVPFQSIETTEAPPSSEETPPAVPLPSVRQEDTAPPPMSGQKDTADDLTEDTAVYYPVGTEYVKSDSDLPKADNRHVLPDTSGIVYEIAEELYCREKTAAEIEALCQPPFHKVFDRQQMALLDRKATEQTRQWLSELTNSPDNVSAKKAALDEKPLSLAQAFGLQVLLLVPMVNIVMALLWGFRAKGNANRQVFCRAFLLWVVLLVTAAGGFFAVGYFAEPTHQAFFRQLFALFGTSS